MTEIELGQFYPVQTDALPNTWVVAYVGDFALVVQSGFACGKHGRNDGVPHLRPMNVSRDGALDLSDVKTVPPEFNEKRLRRGDVLFNNTNSPELVGKTAFVNERGNDLAFSNHMTQVQVGGGVSAEFMSLQLHHLWSQKYFFHRCVKHVNQASISATELATRIPFVCPPTNEQRRIVEKVEALFDEIDKGVESLQTARTTLGLYRQSLLKSAFEGRITADWRAQNADKLEAPETLLARIQSERNTRYKTALDDWQDALTTWREDGQKGRKPAKPKRPTKLGAATTLLGQSLPNLPKGWRWTSISWLLSTDRKPMTTGPFGTMLKKEEHKKSGVPVLGIENIGSGKFIPGNKIFVTEEKAGDLAAFEASAGDLAISRSGTVGEVCEVPGSFDKVLISTNLLLLRPNSRVIRSQFFVQMLQGCSAVRKQIKELCKGSSREFLNQSILSSIAFPICSPAEQAEIVRRLDARLEAADAMKAEINAALTRADALRQSILKKAFSGHLVPQDPKDEPAAALLERIQAVRAAAPKAKSRYSRRALE